MHECPLCKRPFRSRREELIVLIRQHEEKHLRIIGQCGSGNIDVIRELTRLKDELKAIPY